MNWLACWRRLVLDSWDGLRGRWWRNGLRLFWGHGLDLGHASLEEFRNYDAAVGVQHSSQAFLRIVLAATSSSEDTGNLSKDADRVDGVDVGDDIAVGVFVLEQKRAEVRLPAPHHVLYRSHYFWIAHDHGLVESREQRPASDRESKNMGVNFGHRLLGNCAL